MAPWTESSIVSLSDFWLQVPSYACMRCQYVAWSWTRTYSSFHTVQKTLCRHTATWSGTSLSLLIPPLGFSPTKILHSSGCKKTFVGSPDCSCYNVYTAAWQSHRFTTFRSLDQEPATAVCEMMKCEKLHLWTVSQDMYSKHVQNHRLRLQYACISSVSCTERVRIAYARRTTRKLFPSQVVAQELVSTRHNQRGELSKTLIAHRYVCLKYIPQLFVRIACTH